MHKKERSSENYVIFIVNIVCNYTENITTTYNCLIYNLLTDTFIAS